MNLPTDVLASRRDFCMAWILIEGYVAQRPSSPARGCDAVTATFHISPEQIAELRAWADREGKIEPLFNVDVIDVQGEVVAKVEKQLCVRNKQ